MFSLQKFNKKIKNKKLKGNVSLLVILVLLASSVIGLLSINQIQHLMTYGNMTFNYFRSYYLAKAGTELGLTEVYNRDSGFENQIQSGDAIVTENLVGDYVGFNPYFKMDIKSNFEVLTEDIRFGCENGNKIKLIPGDGIVIPLFRDITTGTNNILVPENGQFKGLKKNEIENITFEYPNSVDLIFGFFAFDNEDMSYIKVKTGTNINAFLRNLGGGYDANKKYLTIKNSSDTDVEFCIKGIDNKQKFPYSDAIVTVQSNYADMEVGLQSLVKRQTPSWSMNVLGYDNLTSL